ncbi:unnamed protein product [Merluccius merluccius]
MTTIVSGGRAEALEAAAATGREVEKAAALLAARGIGSAKGGDAASLPAKPATEQAVYDKELTVLLELQGMIPVSAMELMRVESEVEDTGSSAELLSAEESRDSSDGDMEQDDQAEGAGVAVMADPARAGPLRQVKKLQQDPSRWAGVAVEADLARAELPEQSGALAGLSQTEWIGSSLDGLAATGVSGWAGGGSRLDEDGGLPSAQAPFKEGGSASKGPLQEGWQGGVPVVPQTPSGASSDSDMDLDLVFSRIQVVRGRCCRSRIDLLLASGGLLGGIKGVTYEPCAWSDHFFLRCNFSRQGEVRGGGLWCLNAELLKDKSYRALVAAIVADGRMPGLPVASGLRRVTVVPFADQVTILASAPQEIDHAMEHIKAFEEATAYSRLPLFFREVLEAWGKLLPHLKPSEVNRSSIAQLPFLQTPFLQHGGRALSCAPLRGSRG